MRNRLSPLSDQQPEAGVSKMFIAAHNGSLVRIKTGVLLEVVL
jgi:hypothetical protein